MLIQCPVGPFKIPVTALRVYANKNIYLSMVVPTYNEAKNIEQLIRQLSVILDKILPNEYELIVVDDDSPDHTWEISQSLASQYPSLKVICRKNERGLAGAVIRGWQVAGGDILGVIDGDLQHPSHILPQLSQAIETADLVVASRNIEGGGISNWSFNRRIISRIAQILGRIILPEVVGRVSDPMSGYFLVRRSSISGRRLYPLGYKILIEVLARGGKGIVSEVGYVFRERKEGGSKANWRIFAEYICHLLILRFSIPLLK